MDFMYWSHLFQELDLERKIILDRGSQEGLWQCRMGHYNFSFFHLSDHVSLQVQFYIETQTLPDFVCLRLDPTLYVSNLIQLLYPFQINEMKTSLSII